MLTLEGGEGAGKTTQLERAATYLRARGTDVVVAREPGGTPAGELIRNMLKHGDVALAPAAELFLYLAARAQLVDDVIFPALASGRVVILDRFVHSTLAYQGYGLGVELGGRSRAENVARLRDLCLVATRGLWPQRTFLLDVPVRDGLARRAAAGAPDRIEERDAAFHERVRDGYLALARAEPEVVVVLDGTLTPENVACEINRGLKDLL